MFQTFQQAADFVKTRQVQMVDLKFCDLWGRWHHLTLPASAFTHDLMEKGIGFDGSAVGLKSIKAGDMVLVPDLSTGAMDPFHEAPTLSFICSTMEADTRRIFHRDPRNIARRAEMYLQDTCIGDESLWGPEFEFYVFDRAGYENEPHRSGYWLEAEEAAWNSARSGDGYQIAHQGGYHAIPPLDRLYNLRSEMALRLLEMGVEVKYHHHEAGGAGQCEMEVPLIKGLVRAGDVAMLVKYVTKMVAHRHGKTVTFLPKPLYGEPGNGMHVHQTLLKRGKNLFWDERGYAGLSQTALYYIGGLLEHGPALLAFTNPSTNSYRRLVPGFEAPVKRFFSVGNRSAAIRVPKYANTEATKRIEFRPPDATGNIYLSLSAQLLAGLDGIQRQIDPTANGFGPIDEDVFAWPPEKQASIPSLPTTLDEALEALEEDHSFLLQGDVFDEELIQDWIAWKREREIQAVRSRPHPYEMALYFDL
ncbi:MAG: type I glutamate--ammonia ligase [Anaerolineae bacterium]